VHSVTDQLKMLAQDVERVGVSDDGNRRSAVDCRTDHRDTHTHCDTRVSYKLSFLLRRLYPHFIGISE